MPIEACILSELPFAAKFERWQSEIDKSISWKGHHFDIYESGKMQ